MVQVVQVVQVVQAAQAVQVVLVVQVVYVGRVFQVFQVVQVVLLVLLDQVVKVVQVPRELYTRHIYWSAPGLLDIFCSISFIPSTQAYPCFRADLSFSRSKLFNSKVSNFHRSRTIGVA